MRRRRGALALALLLLLPAGAGGADDAPLVLLVSLDGVRHDYLERTALPGLARMAREGARAERLVPPFPSNTFPAHVSLATGTHPDRHGIVDNRFEDPERGRFDYSGDASWLEAEPLWAAAERQGVPSAVFFWVGSETPWHGVAASLLRTPFDPQVPESAKVDQLLAWLDLPPPERPRLLMAWWHGADRAGHRYTPASAAVTDALREQDAQLVRLQRGLDARGLWPRTTLLVVSDHGMATSTRRVNASAALADAGIAAHVEGGGGTVLVYLERPERSADAARVLGELPFVTAWPRDALPERLRARNPRTGDVVALAELPARFAGRATLAERVLAWLGRPFGAHGYDPEQSEMSGILLALGRGVPPGGQLGRVHAIDVAPTAAALLGIEPPAASEGRALLPTPGLP